MRTYRSGIFLGVLCTITASSYAQPVHIGKVLIPVVLTAPIDGAFGSVWSSELVVMNEGSRAYDIGLDTGCRFTPCPYASLEPGRTIIATNLILGPGSNAPPAFMLEVEKEGMSDVKFGLRVSDLSRSASNAGVSIPVVPETEAFKASLQLLDVRHGGGFRAMLRVYDFDPGHARQVAVRFYEINTSTRFVADYPPDQLIFETVLELVPTPPGSSQPNRSIPGYAELSLGSIPELEDQSRLRVEIEPLTEGLRFWAMASITNNETQQVTVALPDGD